MLISMTFSLKLTLVLTHDWKNDHNKIKNIPSNVKEVLSQGDELEHALCSEYDDKDKVDHVQDFFNLCALVIRLHHHGDHVQTDQGHDQDVEVLLCNNVEDEALETVLQEVQTSDVGGKYFSMRN